MRQGLRGVDCQELAGAHSLLAHAQCDGVADSALPEAEGAPAPLEGLLGWQWRGAERLGCRGRRSLLRLAWARRGLLRRWLRAQAVAIHEAYDGVAGHRRAVSRNSRAAA
eukprot:scaffold8845_cov55-Phaeocystis_antarctica.AAC.2